MSFGDWELFRNVIQTMREQEAALDGLQQAGMPSEELLDPPGVTFTQDPQVILLSTI